LKWKLNNWKTSSGQPVKNQDLLRPIAHWIEDMKKDLALSIEFIHVRSHTGIKGNEEADRLAVGAL